MLPHRKRSREKICEYCGGRMKLKKIGSGQYQFICENDKSYDKSKLKHTLRKFNRVEKKIAKHLSDLISSQRNLRKRWLDLDLKISQLKQKLNGKYNDENQYKQSKEN